MKFILILQVGIHLFLLCPLNMLFDASIYRTKGLPWIISDLRARTNSYSCCAPTLPNTILCKMLKKKKIC